ncbi:hypothetical protein NCHU2750_15690 [Neorhizobium sp. NCHU2750]|nr:hypothetical protein NCHU2750_15690 [Neorhizobium sp. NCHU2750]
MYSTAVFFVPNVTLQEITGFAALCFSLAVSFYVIEASGYFSVVGPEFIGIYFDDNLIAGVVEVLPTISLVLCLIFLFSNFVYSNFEKRGKERNLLQILWWSDWGIGILFSLAIFFPSERDFLPIKVIAYYLNAMVLLGICYIQIFRFDVVRWSNVAITIFIWYTAIYQGGRASAVLDLAKAEPRFFISTAERDYANAVILRATAKGVIIHSGTDVIFYRAEDIKRIGRPIGDIKIMKP